MSISDDDKKSWREAMQHVVPLKADHKINVKPAKTTIPKMSQEKLENPASITFYDNDVEQPETIFFVRPGLQYRVRHQFRQGKMFCEATLDLHGLTVEEARNKVSTFLLQSLQQHRRVVKIIHGKGFAILRSKVYQWLPQCPAVLAICTATASDGGSGAVYVLLRK